MMEIELGINYFQWEEWSEHWISSFALQAVSALFAFVDLHQLLRSSERLVWAAVMAAMKQHD